MAHRTPAQLARVREEYAQRQWHYALHRAAQQSGLRPSPKATVKFIVFTGSWPHAVWVNCDGKFLATTPIMAEALTQAA